MHKLLLYNKFIIFVYMFRALLCSSSGRQNCIIQYLVSSRSVGGRLHTGRPPTERDGYKARVCELSWSITKNEFTRSPFRAVLVLQHVWQACVAKCVGVQAFCVSPHTAPCSFAGRSQNCETRLTVYNWSILRMRNISDEDILWAVTFFESKILPFMRHVEEYGGSRQATDDSITRRMRFACRITKATETRS